MPFIVIGNSVGDLVLHFQESFYLCHNLSIYKGLGFIEGFCYCKLFVPSYRGISKKSKNVKGRLEESADELSLLPRAQRDAQREWMKLRFGRM